MAYAPAERAVRGPTPANRARTPPRRARVRSDPTSPGLAADVCACVCAAHGACQQLGRIMHASLHKQVRTWPRSCRLTLSILSIDASSALTQHALQAPRQSALVHIASLRLLSTRQ